MITTPSWFHIVGAGRSGTSLLTGLLDYHSQLHVDSELYSVDFLKGRRLQTTDPTQIFQQRTEAYMAACEQAAHLRQPALWGNKITTEQIKGLEDHNHTNTQDTIPILHTFFNDILFKKSVIYILRDGRSCIASKMKRGNKSLEQSYQNWLYSVDCYRFFKTQHDYNLIIRFEDLVTQPVYTLERICDFLGIPYEAGMLRGTQNKKLMSVYQNNDFLPEKAQPYRLSEPYQSRLSDHLVYCGYTL